MRQGEVERPCQKYILHVLHSFPFVQHSFLLINGDLIKSFIKIMLMKYMKQGYVGCVETGVGNAE